MLAQNLACCIQFQFQWERHFDRYINYTQNFFTFFIRSSIYNSMILLKVSQQKTSSHDKQSEENLSGLYTVFLDDIAEAGSGSIILQEDPYCVNAAV